MNISMQIRENEMKTILLALSLLLITGCEYTYRYECQNPDNQGLPQCQPEVCGPSKTCFNDLNGIESQTEVVSNQDGCTQTSSEESFE